jgi:murein DD-endopeptidase MepM/ murein hydrolase activator NlpD
MAKILGLVLLLLLTFSARAQVERRDHEIIASGLSVAFPSGYACDPVSSPFASPTRHDGSLRRGDRNSGLHGGIDLSLEDGTPLLVIADGEVLALGEGAALEGIYIWFRHTPEDTGLPLFVFSKYQHLSTLPALKVGDRVKAGQLVGFSGATGTAGKHYGPNGYAHLHLSTFYGPSGEYEIKGLYRSLVSGKDARLDDPLILYLEGLPDLSAIRGLPDERKAVRPAVLGIDGRMYPEGRKVVWPVPCRELSK